MKISRSITKRQRNHILLSVVLSFDDNLVAIEQRHATAVDRNVIDLHEHTEIALRIADKCRELSVSTARDRQEHRERQIDRRDGSAPMSEWIARQRYRCREVAILDPVSVHAILLHQSAKASFAGRQRERDRV